MRVQNARPGQNRQRVGIGIFRFEFLQHAVQVVERFRRLKPVFVQQILSENQAAVVERLIEERREVVTFAVLQVEIGEILFQAEFRDFGVKIRRPIGVIADRNDGSVQSQGGVLPLVDW